MFVQILVTVLYVALDIHMLAKHKVVDLALMVAQTVPMWEQEK